MKKKNANRNDVACKLTLCLISDNPVQTTFKFCARTINTNPFNDNFSSENFICIKRLSGTNAHTHSNSRSHKYKCILRRYYGIMRMALFAMLEMTISAYCYGGKKTVACILQIEQLCSVQLSSAKFTGRKRRNSSSSSSSVTCKKSAAEYKVRRTRARGNREWARATRREIWEGERKIDQPERDDYIQK